MTDQLIYEVIPLVEKISSDQVLQIVSAINGRAFADRCSALNAALIDETLKHSLLEAQVSFINLLGQDDKRDRVVANLVTSPDAIIADPIGLAVLAAYALTYGTGLEPRTSNFLLALMGLNFQTLRDPCSDNIRFSADSMASAIASAVHSTERLHNVQWRFTCFYEWAESKEARDHEAHVRIKAEFLDVLGVDLNDLILCQQMLYKLTSWSSVKERGCATFTCHDILKIDRSGHLNRLLERISITMAELSTVVHAAKLQDLRGTIATTLLKTPVVAIDTASFIVPHPKLLDNLIGLGWFYALLDHRKTHGKQESSRFLTFFGAFFEQYIVNICERIAANSDAQFWREQEIDGLKTSDAIVKTSQSLQFIEVVSSRLSHESLRDPSNEEQLERDFDRIVLEKVKQLAENINWLKAGTFESFGISRDYPGRIFPILIQYRQFLRTDDFQFRMQVHFRELLSADFNDVAPVEILDAEIIECLEAHLNADLTLAMLIDEKHQVGLASTTFKNFMSAQHPNLSLRLPDKISAQIRLNFEELADKQHGWMAI